MIILSKKHHIIVRIVELYSIYVPKTLIFLLKIVKRTSNLRKYSRKEMRIVKGPCWF